MSQETLTDAQETMEAIAIIGMAGRFPGARNIDELWENLSRGVESITFFSDEELENAGIDSSLLRDPNYIKAGGVLEDADHFDPLFFGYSPREAELMDPQQRVFLECAWEAMEHAGYDSERYKGAVGVYAGSNMSSYLHNNLHSHPDLVRSVGTLQLRLENDKDFIATRVSYKMNLKGSSMTVQTACSTSLVAVHVACQSLLDGENDIALAGGVSINFPQTAGYIHQEGGILSPDGHCRAFDADAAGTIGGRGAGVVVLKRLSEAIADRDSIHAVIRGSAINNDGSLKVGFTAPSVEGQAEVIAAAHAISGVDPDTISYIEAHGTGTNLGDPIEIAALTQAFRLGTDRNGFCAIGSLKTNIGHLDAAAGVAGLIKTVLSLKHRQIPPSLHYSSPNPEIDFEETPFHVNSALAEWKSNGSPRRAGVSSFGMGGTNAHVVVEEAPYMEPSQSDHPWHVLTLSARTPSALDRMTDRLRRHLHDHPGLNMRDLAFTLHLGRKMFEQRRIIVCRDQNDAIATLEANDRKRIASSGMGARSRTVSFMFTGQGSQHINMGRDLYENEPVFREEIDRCCEMLRPIMGLDLRETLFPSESGSREAEERIGRTEYTQPALFVLEYALAQLWLSWGVRPDSLIGHSIGEYVAACIAGVFSLPDALRLVAARGRLMGALPRGSMLAVFLTEEELRPLLDDSVSIAAINTASTCVVSGPSESIEDLRQRFTARGIECRPLATSHAFHSPMMDPCLDEFIALVRTIEIHPPQIPYISNTTGEWITAEQVTRPEYWAEHLRRTVHFAAGIGQILKDPDCVVLEVGPGQTLTTLARRHPEKGPNHLIIASMRNPHDETPQQESLLHSLGDLWLGGVEVDWEKRHARERCSRIALPTYPFDRRSYWIAPGEGSIAAGRSEAIRKKGEIAEWFYLPSWRRAPLPASSTDIDTRWLLLVDEGPIGREIERELCAGESNVVIVRAGDRFSTVGEREYTIDPGDRSGYGKLLDMLHENGIAPTRIVHCWSPGAGESDESWDDPRGFRSLLYLTGEAAKRRGAGRLEVIALTSHLHDVSGEESIVPAHATLLGLCKVIPQEYPGVVCRSVDLMLSRGDDAIDSRSLEQLLHEIRSTSRDTVVAYRGRYRWTESFEPLQLPDAPTPVMLRDGGVYLLTGGLGGVALLLAEYLAGEVGAKLVLVGRSSFPSRRDWDGWLAGHGEDDPVSRKIERLKRCESMGGEVEIVVADVTDHAQMREAIELAERRFGALHGVIHSAAEVGEDAFAMIEDTGDDVIGRQFGAKVRGAISLDSALQGRAIDFCLLQSSLASALGGLRFAAYAAANSFIDALATRNNRTGERWLSVNWDAWKLRERSAERSMGSALADLAITPEEAPEVFRRLFSIAAEPRILVSTADLQLRLSRWAEPGSLEEKEVEVDESASAYPRPEIATDYVAPRNEIEEKIAAIWLRFFSMERIGIHDNFFELGGDSLMGLQILSRLRESYSVDIPMKILFKDPTIAELALAVANLTGESTSSRIERADPVEKQVDLDALGDEDLDALLKDLLNEEGEG